MATGKKKKEKDSSAGPMMAMVCCRVEALVSVDERGQMVLPKELRERMKIKAGDKLAVSAGEKDGEVCCLFLTKAGDLAEMVKASLGPMMQEMFQQKKG